ncbi:MAG: glycosyltransferase family 9 protein [Armatimonadetes bacterium]|nr:glycosyltransferase family 9 protein [Armatimonadota bacterium]
MALLCGGSLASLIQLTPLMRALRERSPHLHLLAVVRTDTAPLLQETDLVDRLLALPPAAWTGGPRAWLPVARSARRWVERALLERPTLCGVAWDHSPRLARTGGAWLCRAGVPRRFGFIGEPAGLFTHVLPEPKPPAPPHRGTRHEALRLRSLMNALGLHGFECSPDIALRREERQWARHALTEAGLDPSRPIVAVNPTADHRLKEWPAPRIAELLDRLAEDAQRVILAWGPRARRAGRVVPISSGCPDTVGIPVLAATRDPRELAAILARCAVLVTGDADPMHLATAVGTPVVALYGPTNPEWFGPLGRQHQILRHPVACSPCAHDERVPPCPNRHACMQGLETEPVLRAVRAALRARATAPAGHTGCEEAARTRPGG